MYPRKENKAANTMTDTFLDELSKEQEDPFAHLGKEETDTPAESSTENNDETEEPKEGETPENTPEKPLPFHEHPRWKEREQELEELRAFREEAMAKLAAIEKSQESSDTAHSDIPKWFSTLYGENPEAWDAYQEYDSSLRESIKRDVLESQERERTQAIQEEQKWHKWIDDSISALEAEGLKFDRNELIKTVLDYGPTDEHNNYDFRKAYNILQATKLAPQKPSNEAKKRIANMSSTAKSGEGRSKEYVSSAEIRKIGWGQIN